MRNSFLIALLPIVVGFAATPEPLADGVDAGMGRTVELLAKQADADSQAAAGVLSAFSHRDQSLLLLAQASLLAPERADLVWLNIRSCQSDASCDPEPLERRLRVLDEKNGAGWLGALARSSTGGDEEAKSAALAAIGRSERVDIYWTSLIARLSRKVASTPEVSLIDAEGYVHGAISGLAIPAYRDVSMACTGERLQRDDVLEVCRGIADSLLNGDAGITEMIGVALAKRAWPENSPKWTKAAEARRIWDYRARFSFDAWIQTHANDHLALYEQHRREQDVVKALLIATGRNPDPPPIKSGTALGAR